MPPRRPHPRLARRASRLPAVVTAAAAAAVAVAWARAPHPPNGPPNGRPSFVDAAVRRLRAAVVGDVRVDVRVDGAPDPRASPRVRARQALAARVRERDRARDSRDTAGLTPGVPWWADSAHWGPEVIRRRDVVRPAVDAEAGDTLVLPAPDLPALLPDVLRRRGVYWSADGAATLVPVGSPDADAHAEQAGARRVVLGAPGTAQVVAVTAVGRTVTPVRVRAVVRGRVYAADEGAAGRGAVRARVVVARAGAAPDTTWTDADGRFRLALPAGWDGAADVRVEPLAEPLGTAAYAPFALGRVDAARLHTLGVVLVPARWTITAGAYAGLVVPVRAERARGYWPVAADGGVRRPVGWADDAPRTVAFEAGGPPVDTAAFWSAARALGRAWGRALFRPAPAGGAHDRGHDDARNDVHDDAGDGAGDDAAADVTVRVTPGLGALGFTTVGRSEGGVGGARVEFRTPAAAADARVVQHELLHALGFGHARGWASVLAPAWAPGAPVVTAEDVAYGHLFEGIRRQARRAARAYGGALIAGVTRPDA